MYKRLGILGAVILLSGCSAVADFAASKLLGGDSGGGINTELVVGDKEQVVGSNIEVDAKSVGKVVGNSDNSTDATGAEFVEVVNINYPTWLIVVLLLGNVLFLCCPTPTTMWLAIKRKFT